MSYNQDTNEIHGYNNPDCKFKAYVAPFKIENEMSHFTFNSIIIVAALYFGVRCNFLFPYASCAHKQYTADRTVNSVEELEEMLNKCLCVEVCHQCVSVSRIDDRHPDPHLYVA